MKLPVIPAFIKNRYFITGLAFFVWLLFFDENDLISQFKLKREVRELNKNKAYYQEMISTTNQDLQELLTDNQKLEKFAREKYFMKKPNEVIFVFVESE